MFHNMESQNKQLKAQLCRASFPYLQTTDPEISVLSPRNVRVHCKQDVNVEIKDEKAGLSFLAGQL